MPGPAFGHEPCNVTQKRPAEATLLYSAACRVRRLPDASYSRRSPRRPREVGAKPTRSRHCKRRARSLGPWTCSGPGPVTELRPGKTCAAAVTIRESGNLASGDVLFRRGDAGRSPTLLRSASLALPFPGAAALMLRADRVSFAYRADRPALVVDDVSLAIAPRRSGRPARTERLGQDHAAQDAGRHADARRRAAIQLDGRPLAELVAAASSRAASRVVPQETHAPFDFTVLDIVLMGRYPHLGAFALEGPDDLAIARRALAATGTSAFEARAVRHAQRRREAARRDRQRAGAEPGAAAARRADGVARPRLSARSAALLAALNRDERHDDGAVDARSESGGGAVPAA